MTARSTSPAPVSARQADRWCVPLGTERLCLLPDHAIWWEGLRTVIVADLHLEKGSAFAMTGQFLPPYDTIDTLDRLLALVRRHDAVRVIALGDSFHDDAAPDRLPAPARERIAALERSCEILWVEGNHDARAGLIATESVRERGLTLSHLPVADAHAHPFQVVGHFHPKVDLRAGGHRVVRRCFVMVGGTLAMPAFGSYAGGMKAGEVARLISRAPMPAAAYVPHGKGMLRYPLPG